MIVRIDALAEQELKDAAQWYEHHQRGLGQAFVQEVTTALTLIEQQPRRYPRVKSKTVLETRRALLGRFPYLIVFEIRGKAECYVLAIAHGRRRSGYWRK